MSLLNRLIKLEMLHHIDPHQKQRDYIASLTLDELEQRLAELDAETSKRGCPNCQPCSFPDLCRQLHELKQQMEL